MKYCWLIENFILLKIDWLAGAILESKGKRVIFQKKGKEMLEKSNIFENLGKNMQNLKTFWKGASDCVR